MLIIIMKILNGFIKGAFVHFDIFQNGSKTKVEGTHASYKSFNLNIQIGSRLILKERGS